MLKAIFSPITLAFVGLTLVTLAASNASENEEARTEQFLKELIETRDFDKPESPSPKTPEETDTAKALQLS